MSCRLVVCCAAIALIWGCGEDPGSSAGGTLFQDGANVRLDDAGVSDVGSASALLASVYLHDPVTDEGQTTEVELPPPTDPSKGLIGPYAAVRNCLNESGGQSMETLGFTFGALCKEEATVVPGADGTYLHVAPPEDPADPNDGFAEVMMYHHIHAIHDYFKNIHGLTDLDYPLPALVNLNLWFDPEVAKEKGLEGGWIGYPNAAFMPPKGFTKFQLPERDEGHIIFGQYEKHDLSYDATVIYHEYTHAMVGTTRLSGLFADKYGLNNQPGAMNEGFADYFAATMMNHPVVGTYGIAFAGEHLVRDLRVTRVCPNDVTSEVHADGRIFASALWAIREKVGAAFADAVILRALQGFTNATGFEAAAKAIVGEAELEDFDRSEQMLLIFKKQGVIGCVRATKLENWDAESSVDKARFTVEGTKRVGGGFVFGVPAYKQWIVSPKPGTTAITLRWKAASKGAYGQVNTNPNLRLYVQHGKPVTISTIAGGGIEAQGYGTPDPDADDDQWQSVSLTGKCLPAGGGMWLLLTNFGVEPATIDKIEVVMHTSSHPELANVTDCSQ